MALQFQMEFRRMLGATEQVDQADVTPHKVGLILRIDLRKEHHRLAANQACWIRLTLDEPCIAPQDGRVVVETAQTLDHRGVRLPRFFRVQRAALVAGGRTGRMDTIPTREDVHLGFAHGTGGNVHLAGRSPLDRDALVERGGIV